jgi:hypothetical protein
LLSDPTTSVEQSECTHNLGIITKEEEASTKVTSLTEEIPELCQSPEYKSLKSDVNLRRSLAWDSAFFTCEGTTNSTNFICFFFFVMLMLILQFRKKMVLKGGLFRPYFQNGLAQLFVQTSSFKTFAKC